jgi:hypothetical protein
MSESELTVKEHAQNIAEAEKALAETKAAAADAKFPKFPDTDLIKEHADNVAEAERALAKAKADAVFVKETEAHTSVKEHEEKVAEAENALAEAKAAAEHEEFPKWVVVHESHVVRSGVVVATDTEEEAKARAASYPVRVPMFAAHHVARDGTVTVLVHDADEEAKALGAATKEETAAPTAEKKDL